MIQQEAEALMLYNRATRYLEAGRKDKAWQFYKKSIKLHGSREAYLNMGTIMQGRNDLLEAERYYKKSIEEDPKYPLALNNLGLIEWYLGKDISAIEYLNAAIDNSPGYHEAHWNRSLALLRMWCEGALDGDGARLGWLDYEHRFTKKTNPTALKMDVNGMKRWEGEKDGRIIVVSEQGMGDVIMFGRYVMALTEEGYDITMQCSPEIADLFPSVKSVMYPQPQAYDYFIPMCSLTLWNGVTIVFSTVDEGLDFPTAILFKQQ